MKFVCDRCQTRYSIADEKIRERILRIRCKTCGNVITVQAGVVVSSSPDSPKRQEPGAGSPSAARPPSKPSLAPTSPHEWFVAVDGAERGPLSCADAARYIVSLKPEQSVHVWKEGMDGWKRPKDVAIIAQEISALRLSPARASSHMPVVPTDGSSARHPVPSAADSASRLQVPGSRPKPAPIGGSGSGPKLPQPRISGSGPRLSPPIPGSGPKTAPPPIPGSGPKTAPPPIPGSGPKTAPPPGLGSGPKLAPAAGSGLELARHRVSDSEAPPGGLSLGKGPALPGLTPSSPGPSSPSVAPGLATEFDKAPAPKPEERPSRAQGVAALGTDLPVSARPTVPLEGFSDDEFDQAQKTPLPGKPLPPIAAPVDDGPAGASWPSSPLAHAPAPSAGSLFGDVTALPVGPLPEEHVHSDLSKLASLAALAQRHRHLKYAAAAGVVVVLVVLVILLSWRGESGKAAPPALPSTARDPEAPSLGEVETPPPPPQDEVAAGLQKEGAVGSEAAPKGRTTARRASKRSAIGRSAGRSGKAAAVGEDPFEGPSPSSRRPERPVPVQVPSQSRASRPGSPVAAAREVSQAQIGAFVRNKENQDNLKMCYDRALKRDERLRTGRLDITVSVGATGVVQGVQVHGPSDFMIIEGCIKNAIRHWHFPANAEDYATTFPLILQGG